MSGATTTNSRASSVLKDLGFTKLSEGISLRNHSTDDNNHSSEPTNLTTDPTLIILCSWAFAQPRHIAKYIIPYISIYPTASILLVQNVLRNSVYVPDVWQYPFFQPAAAAVQAHVSSTTNPRVLLHAFSNGGSHAAVQLSEVCRETCGGMRLPLDSLILDSAPGIPRAVPTVNACVQGVPSSSPILRGTAAVLGYIMVGTTALCEVLGVMEPAARKLYRRLYDPSDVFLFKGPPRTEKTRVPVPRTYIFSKLDDMIFEEDVVAHAKITAAELERSGLSTDKVHELVRLEEFVGTAHVNHLKGDTGRYWRVVRDTWERSQQS